MVPDPKGQIPPDVHDEDALQVSGRTVEAWANRSQHVETDVDSSAERMDKAHTKGKKRKATTVNPGVESRRATRARVDQSESAVGSGCSAKVTPSLSATEG
jgi:hypothetical protein